MKNYIINRIKEPSSWAGLGILLTIMGHSVAPDTLGLIQQTVTGLAGLYAVVAKEGA